MNSSYSKKFLIKQAELDRLQQRQLREHLPELHAIVRLLKNMRDITANKKLTAEKRLNSISGLQIQFNKLKKETGLLSGAIPLQVAFEEPPAARPVQPKVLADKGIGPEIEPEENEQNEKYEHVLEAKDKSAQASALTPQITRVIRWNVPCLYQQTAHRLVKKITELSDILTRNENKKAVIYGNAIPGSNFKSLFKSMVSNQQNFNQIGIDEFICALRSLGVKKDDISDEPVKIKYSEVAPNRTHQRHSTPTKYEDEEEDDYEDVRPPSHKYRGNKDKQTSSSSLPQKGKGYVHKPPGRKPNILYVY